MGHLARKRLTIPLPLLLAALLAPGTARANGFALDIQGLFSNGTASAGAASAHDPAGQFANPAVIASIEGTHVVAGAQLIAGRAPYRDDGSTMFNGFGDAGIDPLPLGGTNQDGAQPGLAPWLFVSHRLSPALAVGFQLTPPFGTATDYGRDKRFYGRYFGVESSSSSLAFGPTVAYRPIEQLAVGVSVQARRDEVIIGQAFDDGFICVAGALQQGDPDPFATCGAMGLVPGESDGYFRFKGTGWGWTGTVGVTFDPVPGTQLGLAYRHESTSKVKGTETFDATTAALLGQVYGKVIPTKASASVNLPLPDFFTLSASHRVGPVTLLAAWQYTLWNRFDTLTLRSSEAVDFPAKQGLRNASRFSGGLSVAVLPEVDVFGGVAYEQSPVTTKVRQATLPETDTLLAGLGADAKLWKGLTLGAVYQRVQALRTSRIDQVDDQGHRMLGHVKASANVAVLQLGWRH